MYIHTVFRFWWSLLSEQATSKGFLLGTVSFFGNIVSLVNICVYFFIQIFLLWSIPKKKKEWLYFSIQRNVSGFSKNKSRKVKV